MDVKQRLCYLDMANSSASIMDGYDGFLRREVVFFSWLGVGVPGSSEPTFILESLKNSTIRRDVCPFNSIELVRFCNYAFCIKYN